ncbi:MAG: hypothetical protein P8N17_08695, partial [Luminiphilus sp.]|nr:hypothetical protein [Luminiphilus sp.]
SRGTTCVLTFNLINTLAESVNRSNALFWLTVWLTAKDQGPWTMDHGPGVTGAVSLLDLDFVEGVGLRMAGPCVFDRWFT